MVYDNGDPALAVALRQSHVPSYFASAFYGSEITIADLPIHETGSLEGNAQSQSQWSGNLLVRRDSPGVSYAPKDLDDPLAPFGQEITLSQRIKSGRQEWLVPLGRFVIADVPDSKEFFRRYPAGESLTRVLSGFEVSLKLRDRLQVIRESDFLQPESPNAGNTTWQEIQRLSPFPVVQTLADQPLPAGLVYTDSRYDAIATLMDNLGGLPTITRLGYLSARVKDPWLVETVPVFNLTGTIAVKGGLSNKVYNAVRARSSIADSTIVGIAQITAEGNPLRVGGPFNGGAPKTYGYASPLLDTQGKADAAAATILARVSTQKGQKIEVTCLPNALLDLGDYGTVTDGRTGRIYTGAIDTISRSLNPRASMQFDMIVSSIEEA